MGYVLCRTCKLKVCLGKLQRDDEGSQIGFHYGRLDDHSLGKFVLRFLAEHIKHEVIVAGDDRVDELDDLCEFDNLFLEPGPDGARVSRRVPCEPPAELRERIEAGWKHPADE